MSKDEKPPEPDKTEPVKEPAPIAEPAPVLKPKKADEMIRRATEAAERIENANKELASLLERRDEQLVEQSLGGMTTAGEQKLTPEQKSDQEAKRFLAGTGFEDMLD